MMLVVINLIYVSYNMGKTMCVNPREWEASLDDV